MLCPESQAILSEPQQARPSQHSQQPIQQFLNDKPHLVPRGTAEQDPLFHLPEYDFINDDLDFLEEDFPTTEIFG